ncbi:MAG: hypothetical protein H6739_35175 [Alphaproteobacteria bacterium]|nr:hypothetical protein [Alphaproteobacteria bacterium]
MPHAPLVRLLILPGALALLLGPGWWLLTTWAGPDYDNSGAWLALLVFALLARSTLSGPAPAGTAPGRPLGASLCLAGALSALGQATRVPAVSALGLAAGVAAVAIVLRTRERPWPVRPWAVAALFAISMPVEQQLHHFLAWPMQRVSASVAAPVLGAFFPGLEWTGPMLVDPLHGARVELTGGVHRLYLLGILGFALVSRLELRRGALALGLLAAGVGALSGNVVNLGLKLAGGFGLSEYARGWLCLAVAVAPLVAVASRQSLLQPRGAFGMPPLRPGVALVASILCLGGLAPPPVDFDAAPPITSPALPEQLGPWTGARIPLSQPQSAYFGRHGGSPEKRWYRGPRVEPEVLLLRSASPVRELHGPRHVMVGAGHGVERVGQQSHPLPTTIWRTVDPGGDAWRVEANLINVNGAHALDVSELAVRWLRRPGAVWMMVARITPWSACDNEPEACYDFGRRLLDSL